MLDFWASLSPWGKVGVSFVLAAVILAILALIIGV